jgi:DNA-binding transcriptional MocR family regulator
MAVEELSLPAQLFSPFIWLPLPTPWRTGDFVEQAKQKGVLVTPAEPFVVGHQPAPQVVRISLTSATDRAELRRGLQVVRSLLKQEPPPGAMEYPV